WTSPLQSGGTTSVASGSSQMAGPSISVPAGSSPRSTLASCSRSPKIAVRVAVRGSASCGASSVTSGPGTVAVTRTVTSSTAGAGAWEARRRLAGVVGVAVALALVVQVGEGVLQVIGLGDAIALDGELEGLAAVAQLVH